MRPTPYSTSDQADGRTSGTTHAMFWSTVATKGSNGRNC